MSLVSQEFAKTIKKMRFLTSNIVFIQISSLIVIVLSLIKCQAAMHYYNFVVKEAPYTRLCSTKKILTVNGEFPGPTLKVNKGDTIYVNVHNKGKENITIHWHGVKQPRNPWSDGPEYITQCPIKPGGKFNQKIIFSNEEGTLWWHAHSDWSRATVHGAIIIYPKYRATYPFPTNYNNIPPLDVPIILGEWWKRDVNEVLEEFVRTGGAPNVSDALTINGQPGDLYECSNLDTFKLQVHPNKTYLLRIVNAAMNTILFFAVAQHNLTVIGSDASYTKPLRSSYITIAPGQTIDALLTTDQSPGAYYMAARAYSSGNIPFDNTTTTAILEYHNKNNDNYYKNETLILPYLPYYNDTKSAFDFVAGIRSINDENHPINVPSIIDTKIFSTVSINTLPCYENRTCEGPNGTRLAASMNNVSFSRDSLSVDILEAYYYEVNGVFRKDFPRFPPLFYNFTADSNSLPVELQLPERGRKARVLKILYGSNVEIVFQNTNLVVGLDHPMHLHGFSFFLVGFGFGNFDEERDKLGYNLVDPPRLNTAIVPVSGWATVRFEAYNPGVWFLHCHLERHLTWGMETVLIVKNGKHPNAKLLPPPPDMPPC